MFQECVEAGMERAKEEQDWGNVWPPCGSRAVRTVDAHCVAGIYFAIESVHM